MKDLKLKLLIEQLDRKFQALAGFENIVVPSEGWIYSVRTALKMTLKQLGAKLNITAQSVKEIEQREKNGSITLNSLKEVGNALDLQFVYAFIPKEKTLKALIDKRAREIAEKIVLRTSTTMSLEDQQNSTERIRQAIDDLTEEIKREMPRYLWD